MKAIGWKTYRTRFLVNAKQLGSSLTFIDHLGRQHCGRKGDYLVESSDGVLSIAPRQIFEDIYVQMPPGDDSLPSQALDESGPDDHCVTHLPLRAEPLKIERIKHTRFHYPSSGAPQVCSDSPSRLRRKSPQPAHPSTPNLGLM